MVSKENDHGKAVKEWLEKHVLVVPEPKHVTLSSFEIIWSELSGSFRLTADNVTVRESFSFSHGICGRLQLYGGGVFVSPLGAPASYAATELTDSTRNTILQVLRELIPDIRPLRKNQQTRKEIVYSTPIEERIISKEEIRNVRKKVNKGFSITKPVI